MDDQVLDLALMTNYLQSTFMLVAHCQYYHRSDIVWVGHPTIYIGISAEWPIFRYPGRDPNLWNFMKWLFIWNWINKIGLLILNNDIHWVLNSRNSRYTLFSFTSRLLDTHLFLLHKIHHSYTDTHIHANASILLVLDVRPEGLAINSLKAQA